MIAKHKLLTILTFTALCVSLAVFAWVSLARFLQDEGKEKLPVIGALEETAVQYASALKPVPVPQPVVEETPSQVVDEGPKVKPTPRPTQASDKQFATCHKERRPSGERGERRRWSEARQKQAELCRELERSLHMPDETEIRRLLELFFGSKISSDT